VLTEAKEAEIPVMLLDRGVDASEDLYLTSVTSDQVHSRASVAGQWLVDTVAGKPCNVVELQGTTGSSPAIDRKKGFEEAIAGKENLNRPQPDRRLHPHQGQGSDGKLPEGRRTAARTSARSTPTMTTWPSAPSRRSRKPA
jgi:hypothetical protein